MIVRILTILLVAFAALADTVTSKAQDEDSGSEMLLVQGWRYCSAETPRSCIKPGDAVQVYSRNGDALTLQNLSRVNFPLEGEYNPEFAIVKIADHGCKTSQGQDDSCWVMKRILLVQYCKNGTRVVRGDATTVSSSATSMGSGGGCRQS